MGKLRLTLGTAMAVSVAAIFGLHIAPLGGWIDWLSMAGMALAGLFTVAVGILFLMTLLEASDDLWNTGYFRYMRAFWGNKWGGAESVYKNGQSVKRSLQISTCRATWLSAVTLFVWALVILAVGTLGYLGVQAGLGGVEYFNNWDADAETTFAGTFTVLAVAGVVSYLVLFLFMFIPFFRSDISYTFPRLGKVATWALGLFLGVSLINLFVIVPIRSVGVMDFLIGFGAVAGGAAALALAVAIIIGIIMLVMKVSERISQATVPGILMNEQFVAWKKKTCPIIIQKQKTEDSVSEKTSSAA